jgi:hypothetical protein
MTHTVGPWANEGEGATVALVLAQPGTRAVAVTAPLTSRLEHLAPGEPEANAALIVHAPDLLAAARVALEALRAGIFQAATSQAAATASFVQATLERAIADAEGGSRG